MVGLTSTMMIRTWRIDYVHVKALKHFWLSEVLWCFRNNRAPVRYLFWLIE